MTISRKYKNSNITVLKKLFDNTLSVEAEEASKLEGKGLTQQPNSTAPSKKKGLATPATLVKAKKRIPLIDTSKLLTQ